MARPHGRKRTIQALRRPLSGVGAFAVAAALGVGSPALAHADLDDVLDPIFNSLTDSIAIFDPAAALDFSNWADTLLDSLGSFDLLSSTDGALAAAAAAPQAAPVSIPLEVLIGTEPAVNASLNGGDAVPLLVDTGSSGLVVPLTQFGDNYFEQLQTLFSFGFPVGLGSSGYSGGVDYFYLTYNSVPVDYTDLTGATTVLETDGPVNVEFYSFNPSDFGSLFTNDAFQSFLDANHVDGILGIGYNAYGPEVSPFVGDYDGVLVDIPGGRLLLGDFDTAGFDGTSGAPISMVTEQVNDGTRTAVTANFDSGGVFGTIPSSLAPGGSLAPGTEITVYSSSGAELYSYTIGPIDVSDDGTPELVSNAPTAVSGTYINSGVIPFLTHQVYLDYTNNMTYFSN